MGLAAMSRAQDQLYLLPNFFFATPMNTNSSGGGGGIMHAQALDYAMHNDARLCTMHFDKDTR